MIMPTVSKRDIALNRAELKCRDAGWMEMATCWQVHMFPSGSRASIRRHAVTQRGVSATDISAELLKPLHLVSSLAFSPMWRVAPFSFLFSRWIMQFSSLWCIMSTHTHTHTRSPQSHTQSTYTHTHTHTSSPQTHTQSTNTHTHTRACMHTYTIFNPSMWILNSQRDFGFERVLWAQ